MKKLFEQEGIHHQRTVKYTPEQNGSAEREMRTIVGAARTKVHDCDMAEAVSAAVFEMSIRKFFQ